VSILAIDPGLANCGWAVVRPGSARLVDLGLWTSAPAPGIAVVLDRARRIAALTVVLRAVVRAHACRAIAAEEMLCHGTTNAVVPQALVWGALIGIAVGLGIALYGVEAKLWQHAMAPAHEGAVDYERVSRELAGAVPAELRARLELVPPSKRTHVYDAIGVGTYAALDRPSRVWQEAT